jgi:hypothetical protein
MRIFLVVGRPFDSNGLLILKGFVVEAMPVRMLFVVFQAGDFAELA